MEEMMTEEQVKEVELKEEKEDKKVKERDKGHRFKTKANN